MTSRHSHDWERGVRWSAGWLCTRRSVSDAASAQRRLVLARNAWSTPFFCLLALLFAFARPAPAAPVRVPGATVDLQLSGPPNPRLQAVASRWTERAGTAVAAYYGRFQVRGAKVEVNVGDGRGPGGGHSYGDHGPLIDVDLGRDSTVSDVADDWTLTHEMLHLHFPDLSDKHLWLEEGLATYVEPIARARAGFLSPERVWGDLVDRLPDGLPKRGDRGLDGATANLRVYWGGALYCLRADLEIRRRTGNHKGLEHALRAIVGAGGTIESHWTIEHVLAVGDRATGATVLRELYDEMKDKPVTIDLDALWKELGVVRRGSSVVFDDHAPLSAIRRAITQP